MLDHHEEIIMTGLHKDERHLQHCLDYRIANHVQVSGICTQPTEAEQ